jgi:decaprenylphospho-beta-D-ribofuranose 2-oxidase
MGSNAWTPLALCGWGRTSSTGHLVARPDSASAVAEALESSGSDPIVVRGAGRSYGDAALNSGGRVILTTSLNHILSFEEGTGLVVCEPGVTFQDLADVFLERGHTVPVSPGTAFVTVGGAVASDVHGKNHDKAGSFGDHVVWIDLATADGEVLRISPSSEPETFAATIGGMGLTGVMLRICFRMISAPSPNVVVQEQQVANLDAFINALRACRESATYSVGWIDGTATGAALGRGILRTAEFAEEPADMRRGFRPRLSVPFDLPWSLINHTSARAFNEVYYSRAPLVPTTRKSTMGAYYYPLDSIGHWNRLYGQRGFYQFQCVLPDDKAPDGLTLIMEEVSRSSAPSPLTVLKTLGGPGLGDLSFTQRGFTLAVDLSNGDDTLGLLHTLEEITLAHEGRIYLAKDAALSPEGFQAMYPDLSRFRETLTRVDPEARFTSDLARRLRIRA